jgi:hypothetical protein
MDAEINNVVYMELYSGPKMAHDKYEKMNVARSIDRDSTVFSIVTHGFTCFSVEMYFSSKNQEFCEGWVCIIYLLSYSLTLFCY